MNKMHTSNYLQNTNMFKYEILNSLKVEIKITENPYDLPQDFLFGMAARKNKKRGFLFVSKVLGKHIPVKPIKSLMSGALLGLRYSEILHQQENKRVEGMVQALLTDEGLEEIYHSILENRFELPEETLFIGFAETATALGHSVFDVFKNAHYIHTTRESILEADAIINFEEEHSHATAQYCYGNEQKLLHGSCPIVLVDDEITTGKTALNIIEAIHRRFPRKEYAVISLLDWRSDEDKQKYEELEKKLGIQIKSTTLLAGEIVVEGEPVEHEKAYDYPAQKSEQKAQVHYLDISFCEPFKGIPDLAYTSINSLGEVNTVPYSGMTGRFNALASADQEQIENYVEKVGEVLAHTRSGNRALCLGTGEFMHLPMKIAANMGEDIYFHSTTRSPIHRVNTPNYAIRSGFSFPCPDDEAITNYFYNIDFQEYSEIYLFLERMTAEEKLTPLLDQLQRVGAKHIYVVALNKERISASN